MTGPCPAAVQLERTNATRATGPWSVGRVRTLHARPLAVASVAGSTSAVATNKFVLTLFA